MNDARLIGHVISVQIIWKNDHFFFMVWGIKICSSLIMHTRGVVKNLGSFKLFERSKSLTENMFVT